MSRPLSAFCLSLTLLAASPAAASLCDHRLAEVMAARAPVLAAAAGDLATLRAMTRAQPDFFTLVDPQSGQSALGAVLSNATALSFGAQLLGAGGAVVSGPAIGMAAGAMALGLGGLEGICHFSGERISDYYEVLAVLSAVSDSADPALFQLQLGPARKKGAVVEIWDAAAGVRRQYQVADLFFVNGELRMSRWGRAQRLGYLMQFETLSREFGPPAAP